MKLLFRLLVTIISGVTTLSLVNVVVGAILLDLHLPSWQLLVSLPLAIAVGRYVWMHTSSVQPGLISSVVLGAFATGG